MSLNVRYVDNSSSAMVVSMFNTLYFMFAVVRTNSQA